MQNEWEEAKMWNVGIKYKPNAVFKWAEYLFDLGTKLGKTNREMRVKYLEGFPDAFDVLIIPERQLPGMGSSRLTTQLITPAPVIHILMLVPLTLWPWLMRSMLSGHG